MVKKVVTRKAAPAKPKMPEQGKGKGVTKIGVQKVIQLRLDFIVRQGAQYEGESYQEVEAKLQKFVEENWPEAHFHRSGGYYLIDSPEGQREVCRPDDFDFENMTRKPGTRPPSWSMDKELAASIERQYRVLEEMERPPLARNPGNLYTTAETDKLRAETTKAAEKNLDRIAAERPDLIKRPATKAQPKAVNPTKKVLVRKKAS